MYGIFPWQANIMWYQQGLGAYVIEQFGRNAAVERGVVIGYDHRHNSARFARLTAAAFLTQGIKVYFYDELTHTPLVPFGIKHFGALAGVMITASHVCVAQVYVNKDTYWYGIGDSEPSYG